jgi:hypothetical protein
MRIRALPIGCIALAILATSCRKELTAEAIEKSPDAIAERTPTGGTSTWIVRPDGAVSATLKTPDGAPVAQPVTGQMAFATPDGPPRSVPVQYDAKTGVLTAAGPKLEADITPVSYTLMVGGTPWSGTIDVPKGGTQDLVATGKLQASIPPSTVGPNGGVVQVVGRIASSSSPTSIPATSAHTFSTWTITRWTPATGRSPSPFRGSMPRSWCSRPSRVGTFSSAT